MGSSALGFAMRAHYLLCFLFALAFTSVEARGVEGDSVFRTDLRRDLFRNYDRLVKPEGQVAMQLGLTILELAYCPVKEKMYTTVWLRQSWVDNRLAWDPEEYGVQRLQLPVEEVWTPDLSSYGGKLEVVQVSVYDKMTRAVVMADGKVVHVPAMKITSHCPKPVGEEWPTEHNCSLKLGSWTYDVADVDPNFKDGDPVELKYLTNKKVEILDKGIEKIEKEYECCPGQKYVSLQFWFRFKQEAGHSMGKMWGGGRGGYGKGRGGTRATFSDSSEEDNDSEED